MPTTDHEPAARPSRRPLTVLVALALFVATLAVAAPSPAAGHGTLPAGFEDVAVAGVFQPTDMAWTPDGRMIVTSKTGEVRIIDASGNLLATPAIDLGPSLCTNVERGLGGVAVHPDFGTGNNYIYLYFTYNKYGTCNEFTPDSPVNRLSRFELPPSNVIDPTTELVMLDTPYLRRWHHNGGDLEFGPDGYLYVTIGDGGHRYRADDPDWLTGKIVRLTDDGDIPPGNAFSGPGSARCNVDGVPPAGSPPGTTCQEIFTLGHRNPFRFAADPASPSPRFFVLDVGQDDWEEINEVTTAGEDFGWPTREGPCAFASMTDCAPVAGKTDPIHWYPHPAGGGAAITGGAFVPSGVWPSEYEGAFLYADYVLGHIYRMDPGGPDCRLCVPPTSAFVDTEFAPVNFVVEMAFGPYGPTQALYYLTRDGNEVRRIAYVGSANRVPAAAATATPPYGPTPLTVAFDGTASTDPDLDPLTYQWDFGDGSPLDTSPSPTHQFTTPGVYQVSLTVDDGNGGTDTTNVRVDAGNLPPTPVILTPSPSEEFSVGEVLTLTGSATDPEDGPLIDADLTWEVRQHHNVHYHPYLDPTVGNGLTITGPEPEDLGSTTNSFVEVLLTATDSWGLSATVTEIVDPSTVDVTFATTPGGRDLLVDGETITDTTLTLWENWTVDVDAPDQVDGSGLPWVWTSWTPAGPQTRQITVPATPATYTAAFSQATRVVAGSASVTEGDTGPATVDVPITLTVASNTTVSVDWQTADGDATAPADYVAASGTVTFPAGTTAQTVTLTVNGDGIHEGDESFEVQLSNPVNAVLGGVGTVTIVDDEPLPSIKPFGVVVNPEGDTGTTVHQAVVTLSHPSSTPITIDYASLDSPNPAIAASGSDYVGPFNGTLTFAPGSTTATVPVEIIGDTVDEPPLLWGEWGLIGFTNPSANATLDTSFFGLALFIIIDDDP